MFTRINISRKAAMLLSFLLLVDFTLTAQSADVAPQGKETRVAGTKPSTVLPVSLEVKSTLHVANLYAAELNAPAVCGPDGRLYATIFVVRPNSPPGHLLSQSIVGIDEDGKVSLNVSTDSITDVQNARLISFFPGDHEIDLLVRAPDDGDPAHSTPRQGGVETLFKKSDREREFIARFDRDGTYRGSTRIDIPISGMQLGVFPTGQFLIAGIDELNHAKLALLKGSGQLDRYVELSDTRSEDPSTAGVSEPSKEARLYVAAFSRLIANGENILLTSPGSSSVFKISTSGEAQEIRLQGDEANIVQAISEGWVAESSGPKGGISAGVYSRTDGSLVKKYIFSDTRELVFGCMYDEELTFLRKETDGRLLLLVTSRGNKQNDTTHSTVH